MGLSLEHLRRIRSRASGWERDWWELQPLLRAAINGLSGRLRSHFNWPDTDWEDFIEWMLDDYKRRADRGTLLIGYDEKQHALGPDSLVAFLADPGFLRRRMISYRRRLAGQRDRAHVYSLDERRPNGRMRIPQRSDPHGTRIASLFDDLIDRIGRELQRLTLAVPEGASIDRIVEQAGIQLFPRLDWEPRPMDRLRAHLQAVIADPRPEFSDGVALLQHLHAIEGAELAREIAQFHEQLTERRLALRTIRRLEQRADKLRFEQTFRPLGAQSLMRLLGITRADADQRRSRYLAHLPELLPSLAAIVEGGDLP